MIECCSIRTGNGTRLLRSGKINPEGKGGFLTRALMCKAANMGKAIK